MKLRSFFLFSLLVAACGSEVSTTEGAAPAGSESSTEGADRNGGGAGSAADPTLTCAAPDPAARCAPARHVTSAADLVAEAAKLAWQGVSLSKTGTLAIGDDLVADADLEIDASLLDAPADCRSCHAPLFREYAFPRWSGTGIVPGVACAKVGDHPVRKGETCARLTIAKGTTFRLRRVVEDMHPSAPTYWPFVEIERACATPCAADETRCDATQTCFTKGYAACAFCAGSSNQVCACAGACEALPNGTKCSYATSPDVDVTGSCRAGSCERTQ